MTKLDFQKMNGLVPAIVQDSATQQILMVGFMNSEAYEKTRNTGLVTFWSRSRNALWTKGETSGNYLKVHKIMTDCDADTVLVSATLQGEGVCCHTGQVSCFFTEL